MISGDSETSSRRSCKAPERRLTEEYRSISSAVGARLGPFSINRTISREVVIAIFIAFNVVCFAVGIAFILQNGVLQVLGISLVVGGLFSFGTFMVQWWDHMWQDENNTFDRVFKDKPYVKLQQHAEDLQKLYEKVESLPEPAGQSPPSTHVDEEEDSL
jgi:hypothetical protein